MRRRTPDDLPGRGGARPTATPQAPGAPTQTADAGTKAAFEDFLGRVNGYIKLRSNLEATLPKLKPTDQPDKLADHEKALSAEILDARKNARQGDIFTKDISAQFLKQIREEFSGPQGRSPPDNSAGGARGAAGARQSSVPARASAYDRSAHIVIEIAEAAAGN